MYVPALDKDVLFTAKIAIQSLIPSLCDEKSPLTNLAKPVFRSRRSVSCQSGSREKLPLSQVRDLGHLGKASHLGFSWLTQ